VRGPSGPAIQSGSGWRQTIGRQNPLTGPRYYPVRKD
jgi:hypothetical protein